MAINQYIGAFGPALRRLTVQDAQRGAFDPPPPAFSAPPPAFGVAPPGLGQTPVGTPGIPNTANVPGSALGDVGTPFHRMLGKKASDPVSWKDISDNMPGEQKDALADDIEARTGKDVKTVYAEAAAKVGEKPRKQSRREMAGYIAEVALRTMANMGTSDTSAEAFGKGMLQTDERRAAEVREAQLKAEAVAEKQRQEGREETKVKGEQAFKTSERKGAEQATAEQNRLDRESREKVAAIKDELDDPKTRVVVGDDGAYFVINEETGQSLPVTVKRTTTKTKGRRGKKWEVTTTENVPVKAQPRANAGGVDQDTLVRAIQAQIKTMKEDRRGLRALARELGEDDPNSARVNAEIERRARETVMKSFESATGGVGLSEDDPLGLLQ